MAPWRAVHPGIAYSNDRGRTFTKYEKNPVVPHINGSNRDPKVIWHGPSKQWVMALYLGDRGKFRFLGSRDLKGWKKLCDVEFPGGHECPEFFEIPIEGKDGETRWVFYEASGKYMLGTVRRECFKAETEPLESEWGNSLYASQTFNNVPSEDGRRILIGWIRQPAEFHGGPFTQQMSIPRRMTLRETSDGLRLFSEPVAEMEKLVEKEAVFSHFLLQPEEKHLTELRGCLWDIEAEIEPRTANSITLQIAGESIVYDVKKDTLTSCGKTVPGRNENGIIVLRVLADATTLEIFVGGGRYTMTNRLPR